MNDTQDYRLANRARQELKRRELRQTILASESEKALDLIMEAPSPATLIQSFPDQDLYFLMHKIGVHDFLPVLAMASSDQWEYILDVEVWEEDRLDLHIMAQVLDLLFNADPQRLLRWAIMKKPDFMEFFLFHHMQVVVREHDEPPPSDFDDYITLDDKFYFRFPDRGRADDDSDGAELLPGETPQESLSHDEAPDLIESMLKKLAEMDLSVFHGLMLETSALLPAEAEEEEFRLRNIRLAEKGFLPPHEAIGIYQPAGAPRKRPHAPGPRPGQDLGPEFEPGFDPDRPMPPQFFAQFIRGKSLFVQALEKIKEGQKTGQAAGPGLNDIHGELAALVNKIISADRVKMRKTDDLKEVMEKAAAYLSLGLEVIAGGGTDPRNAAAIIQTTFIEDIFRAGSREGIGLKTRAMTWYEASYLRKNNLPLSFLGESFLGVLGGLFIERPMFFANYADRDLYRHFQSLKDIRSTRRILEEIFALDDFLNRLTPDLATFSQGVLTYKSTILTLWAKSRISPPAQPDPEEGRDLCPIPMDRFLPFFAGLFSDGATGGIGETAARDLALWAGQILGLDGEDLPRPLQALLFSLIHELEEEYGSVTPHHADPRFMPLFLLTDGAGGSSEEED